MRIRKLLAAAILAGGLGAPAQAALLDFGFSFTNVANGGGFVTGVVRGLTEGVASAASSVRVTGNTDALGFGLGEYVGNPTFNSFTVAGSTITGASFLSYGSQNSVGCCTLSISLFSGPGAAGLRPVPNGTASTNTVGLTFTQIPAVVPLPAGLPLMIAALAGLVGVGRLGRRARAA